METAPHSTSPSAGSPQRSPGSARVSGSGSLPVSLTSFVGRDDEIALAISLLRRPDLRLLTLTGPGGIGKTRLAVEIAVAAEGGGDFPDGVTYVPLASIQDHSMVMPTIAAAFGLQVLDDADIEESLASSLSTSNVLLVVDNFEHVLDAAPALTRLIGRCHSLKVIVTSRTLLRVGGEHALPVPPLGLPDTKPTMTDDDWLRVPVIRLFLERAQAVAPSPNWTHADVRHIVDICGRLDGLPLAVELAATRVRHLTLAGIRDRLNERLPLLIGGSRDHPSRLQTMRNAIAWSHDLLTPEVQVILRRVAVFTGGFSLDAAERVAADASLTLPEGDRIRATSVFDGLSTLIDASLLQTELLADGRSRYRLLETIREFALERLEARGESSAIHHAHAMYFLDLAVRYELTDLLPGGDRILDVLNAEHANLRAALVWFHQVGENEHLSRLSVSLGRFWADQGYYQEGSLWLGRVVAPESAATDIERAKALVHLGMMEAFQRPNDEAEARLTVGLAGCRDAGATFHAAIARILLGWLVNQRGDHDRATTLLEDAIIDAGDIADARLAGIVAGWALANLAELARMDGDRALATERLEEGLRRLREAGYVGGMILILKDLGELARDQGEFVRALGCYREALSLVRGSPGTRVVTEVIELLGIVAVAIGHAERGARLLGASEAQRERIGLRFRLPMTQVALEPTMVAGRTALGEAAFADAWSAGRSLRPRQAVAEALEPFASAPTAPGHSLTPREMEILRLVAVGQTDPDIAASLFISVRTVENHVARILSKLGVRTRTAAVSSAIAAGFVTPRVPQSSTSNPTESLLPGRADLTID